MAEQISEDDFRAAATRFLEGNAKVRVERSQSWGEGSDSVSIFAEKSVEQELAEVDEAKRWRQQVFDAGFAWITGPPDYGGGGLTVADLLAKSHGTGDRLDLVLDPGGPNAFLVTEDDRTGHIAAHLAHFAMPDRPNP